MKAKVWYEICFFAKWRNIPNGEQFSVCACCGNICKRKPAYKRNLTHGKIISEEYNRS